MTDRIPIEPLGRDVARVALGTSSMGGGQWAGDNDEGRSAETVLHALELGIDMIDTAPVYGFGLAERIVGRVLAEAGARDRVVIATKCGWAWDEDGGELRHDASRGSVLWEVEASLERLQTDRIDLYQLHFPDPSTPLRETAETFAQLFDEGTIRAIGVCNLSAEQMREWREYAPLHTAQDRYSIFDRADEELQPYCREHGIVFLAYSPLARGLLTGTMRPGSPPTDHAHDREMFRGESYDRHLLAAERLGDWADRLYKRPLAAVAVRWALDRTGGIALWGARRPEHLDAARDVWGWQLDGAAMRDVDRIAEEALDTKWVRSAPIRPVT